MTPALLELIVIGVVSLGFLATVAGIFILRPIALRLGDWLEAGTREKLRPDDRVGLEHLREVLESMDRRLSLIEERQDFQERLMDDGRELKKVRSGGALREVGHASDTA